MRRTAGVALTAAAALAACAGARRIDAPPTFGYSFSQAQQVTGGLQRIEIAGAPPDGATPEQVAAALRGPAGFPPTRYEAAPPGGGGTRTVLEFGQPRATAGACTAPRGGGAGDGALVVTAILCRGDRATSTATLTAPDLAGPSSPGFTDAMALLFRKLLPIQLKPRFRFFGAHDD
jgi:hypothetical protein